MTRSSPALPPSAYVLGRFTLQPGRQLLDGDRATGLGGKALDLLGVLAAAEGDLVTKDELMAAVWPGIIVEENAIQVHISAARKALADEADRLTTVRGRGYRLGAVPLPAGDQNPPSALPAASVAVLAFANLTGDPDKDYLADGMAEEIITTLSRCRDLKVPARTSSFAYKGRDVDVRTIARELGVTNILEGSVRLAGDHIRVTAQLIEAATGFHIWVQNFDRSLTDLLALQDDLAAAIGAALETRISVAGVRKPDPEAFRLHLQARALAGRATPDSIVRAIEMHEQVVARDPLFARAWTGLAGTLMVATITGDLPLDRRADARAKAEHAIRLEPGHSAPYAICGVLDASAGRWLDAERGFRAALDLDSSEPTAFDAMAFQLHAPCGQLHRSLSLARQAANLAPATANFHLSSAYFALLCGNHRGAASDRDAAALLGASASRSLFQIVESELAFAEGRFDAAAQAMAGAYSAMAPFQAAGIGDVIRAVHASVASAGDRDAAAAAIARLVAATDSNDGIWRYPGAAGRFLRWQVLLGSLDGAFATADRLVGAWHRTGHLASMSLHQFWRADMRPFRDDSRFAALVDDLGLPALWEKCGPPDGYRVEGGTLVTL